MRHRGRQFLAVLLLAGTLAGCDKCGDSFLVDPFAKPKPAACHGEPAIK